VEKLDILQLHSPGLAILEQDEPWLALEKLKNSGKVGQVGWSVQSFQETAQAHILERHHDLIDVIQVRYNLLEREAENVLFPMALKYGTGVIVRIPLIFGLLSGKFSQQTTFAENDHRKLNLSPEKLNAYLEEFKSYHSVFDKYPDYSPAQLSLRFCIAHPACHVVIPGGKNVRQVQENVVAADIDLIPHEAFLK
jgi:aryl-alcohol dehydrogenase-like predicted oxidoreductase